MLFRGELGRGRMGKEDYGAIWGREAEFARKDALSRKKRNKLQHN